MKALLKITGWLLGLVVVVVIAAILILPKVFDPNDHKGRIESLVLEKTGRVLNVDGDLSLSVFPNVAVKTGSLSLSNPDGGSFGDGKMIEVEAASMDVKLIPLFSKQVEAGEIVLSKPVVRLITLADGTNNWQDLAGDSEGDKDEDSSDASTDSSTALSALAIQGVRIEDGLLVWDDRQAGARYDVSQLNLKTGTIFPGREIPIEAGAHVEGPALPEPLDINLAGNALVDLGANLASVSTLDLTVTGPTINAGVNAPAIQFDMQSSKLDAEVLNLKAMMGANEVVATLPTLSFDSVAQQLSTNGLEAKLSAGETVANVAAADLDVDLAAGQVMLGQITGNAKAGDNSASMTLPSFTTGFDQKKFVFDNVAVDANIGELIARLEAPSVDLDIDAMTLNANGAKILAEGVVATVDVNAKNIAEAPTFDGRIRLPGSDLRSVADKLGGYRAQYADALSAVTLDAEFAGTPELIEIPVLTGMLDQTTLEGSASIDLTTPAYALKLVGGVLDLDHYLPQAGDPAAASPPPAAADGAAAAAAAPVALGSMRVAADIAFQQLSMASAGVKVDQLKLTTQSDASGLVPLSLNGIVSGDAVPETFNLSLGANLNDSSGTYVLNDVVLQADGETLEGRVAVPSLSLDTAGPISLADLTGAFSMGEIGAEVALASLSFDQTNGALKLSGLTGQGSHSGIDADLNANDVSGDINAQAFDLSGVTIGITRGSPLGTLSAPALSVDVKQQTAQASELVFDGDAGQATIAFSATSIIDAPNVQGSIKSSGFNLRRLLDQLELAPEFQDDTALSSVSLDAEINGGLDAFQLKPLNLTLDETDVTGFVNVQQQPSASYGYDINVGRLNLDKYTTVVDPTAVDTAPASGNAAAAVAGPAELLKNLTVDGTVRIESLTTGGMDINNVVLTTVSENGVVTMSPISANLYEGQAQGSVVIDTNGEVPVISADQSLTSLNIGPALAGAGVSDKLVGTGNLVAKITASGVDAQSISRTMEGTVDFNLQDGAIKGFDLQNILVKARRAYETYKDRDSMFEGEIEEQTRFSAMTGTLVIGGGNASNDDLNIMAPLFRITGQGGASLVEQTIDYSLNVNLVESVEGQGGAELSDLRNVTIPVQITGPFSQPAFRVDLVSLLKDKAKEEAKEKLKEKLSEELGLPQTTGVDGEPQSTRDTLKGLLKQKVEQEAGISDPAAESAGEVSTGSTDWRHRCR